MDRALTRTDPLNRQEKYTYDANGLIWLQWTDRKGQATAYMYDGINRATFVWVWSGCERQFGTRTKVRFPTFMMQASRLTQAIDSAGGTLPMGMTTWID